MKLSGAAQCGGKVVQRHTCLRSTGISEQNAGRQQNKLRETQVPLLSSVRSGLELRSTEVSGGMP